MREQISAEKSFIVYLVNAAAVGIATLLTIVAWREGMMIIIPVLVVVVAIAYFLAVRSLAVVSIDHRYLYVNRFSREIRLRPEDIEDVDFWRSSSLMILRFKRPTRFGRYVIFEPSGGRRSAGGELKGARAFERIGKFCGWRE